MRPSLRVRLLGPCVACVLALPALALPRQIDVGLTLGSQMDRNARLARGAGDIEAAALWGIDLSANSEFPEQVTIGGAALERRESAPLLREQIRLEAGGARYRGGADDLDDDRYAASYTRVWRDDLRTARVTLSAADRDARTSETGFGVSEAVRDDNQRRREYAGQFGSDWRFEENATASLDVVAQRTHYHDGDVRRLADFEVRAIALGLRFDLDEYSVTNVVLSRDRFESALGPSSRREDTWGVQLDYSRALSENTRVKLGAGIRRSESELQLRLGQSRFAASEERSGLLAEFALAHSWPGGELAFSATRARQPSGLGAQLERDGLDLDVRLPLDDLRTATISSSFARNRADARGAGIADEQLWSVRLGIAWAIADGLDCNLQLGYRAQLVDTVGSGDANGALVQISIRRQFEPMFQ